jgi:hypothetical protein
MKKTIGGGLLLSALLLSACGGGNELHEVDAAALGASEDEWPLTVESAQVDCLGKSQVGLVVEGETYALNGLASGTGDYRELDAVWRDDPNVDGLKLDVSDLTAWALDRCGY